MGDRQHARFDPAGAIARTGSWTALGVALAGWGLGSVGLVGGVAVSDAASPLWGAVFMGMALLGVAGVLLIALVAHVFGALAGVRARRSPDNTPAQQAAHTAALVLHVLGGGALASAGAAIGVWVLVGA